MINKVSKKQKAELALRHKLKLELLEECGGLCMECGKLPDWRGLSLSHTIPLSLGGKTTHENCQLLCGKCHSLSHGIIEK